MKDIQSTLLLMIVLLSGILFGFFFTMSFSIMPGFDATDPYSAIIANQKIGHATQESFFFVALLGAPLLLIISMFLAYRAKRKKVLQYLALGLVAYLGMFVVTIFGNVPLRTVPL